MRSLLLALLGALVLTCPARPPSAQAIPLDLDLDYATFLYDADASLLELYIAVGAASLPFAPADDGFLATLPLDVVIRPISTGAPEGVAADPILEERRTLQFAVADTSAIQDGQYFVDQMRLAVPPGEYALDLIAPGEAASARPELRLTLDLAVPDYAAAERVRVSDVTLASAVGRAEAGEAESPFLKNGLVITPNPKGIYGEGQSQVFYYVEVYGLPAEREGYTLFTYVSRSNLPQPMEGLQRRTARPTRDPDVLVGAFDVSAVPSGSYFLQFALLDENNEALAEQSKKFFVLNPNVAAPVTSVDENFETSLYAVMGEEEVEANLAHARVIATQQDLAQIRRLDDLDARREFLADFWRRRDVDGDPSVNEARRTFYERLRYVEDRYDTPFREAYETDRGRIVLKYGYPSSVDPHPYESDLVPYEVWTYESIPGEGAAMLVFADREGIGSYDLIHATITGETSNPNWQQMLRR